MPGIIDKFRGGGVGRAQQPAQVQDVKKAEATQQVGKPSLTVGMGPSQAHGTPNDKAFRVFKKAVDNETVVKPLGMRPRQPSDGPARPWEDQRAVAVPGTKKVPVKDLGPSFVFETRNPGTVDGVLKEWASTTHAHMWTTPIGEAMAGFGVERYGQASLQHDGRGKLQHVVEVLNNADRIALDMESRGHGLDPKWRQYLEYAALLHDIGYMNGGFMHPRKGANDIMFHMRQRLADHGVDAKDITDVDLEKIALVVELHGTSFPWDQIDARRLAGTHYVSLGVAEEIYDKHGGAKSLKSAMEQDNKEYIAETGGLSWLSDPAQLRELFRTGWVMHSADNYNGPSSDPLRRGGGRLGRELPIETLRDLDNLLREQDVHDLGRGLMRYFSGVANAPLAGLKTEKERAEMGKKTQAVANELSKLADLLGAALDQPAKRSTDVARDVRALLDAAPMKKLDDAFAKAPKEAARAYDEALPFVPGFQGSIPGASRMKPSEVVATVINIIAGELSKLPDHQDA